MHDKILDNDSLLPVDDFIRQQEHKFDWQEEFEERRKREADRRRRVNPRLVDLD